MKIWAVCAYNFVYSNYDLAEINTRNEESQQENELLNQQVIELQQIIENMKNQSNQVFYN